MDNKPANDLGASSIPQNPQTPRGSVSPAPQGDLSLGNDISRILEEVKLPERKTVLPGAQEKKTLVPETPAPQPAPAPQVESAPRDGLVSVHTLKDDLQSIVKEKKMSLVRAAALEEDKRAHRDHEPEAVPHKKKYGGVLILVGTLVLLGALALVLVMNVMNERADSRAGVINTEGLMFTEQTVPIPTDNQSPNSLKRAVAEARTAGLTLGAILRLVPVTTTRENEKDVTREIPAPEFARKFGINMPEALGRSLGSTYFFGIHTVDENAPVLIFSITSYERAFAGMLAWEPTINSDLTPMFTGVPALTRGEDNALIPRTFSDVVIRNYDVRALSDDAGVIQLYYTFPTRDLLIIAESPYSFNEILSRLRADRRI